MVDPKVLAKFQQKDSKSPVIFTGDLCVVNILQKLEENYGCVSVADTVTTLGVFDMTVDGMQSGMFLVGRIEMVPSDVARVTIDDVPYIQLTFKKGDVFMKSTKVVVEEKLAFIVWLEFIKFARASLKAMTYEDQASMFDRIRMSSGVSFPVDHAVYEAIFSHLSRAREDFTLPFRNTDMKGEFRRIQLSDVTHASRSTSSRIIGAYNKDGINSALDNPNDMHSQIEDLLRS